MKNLVTPSGSSSRGHKENLGIQRTRIGAESRLRGNDEMADSGKVFDNHIGLFQPGGRLRQTFA